MGIFGCGAAQNAQDAKHGPHFRAFDVTMHNGTTARVDAECEVPACPHTLFRLMADPSHHVRIFEAIEGATARLLEKQGACKKYELDYNARWKFWKVSGVCLNQLHLETDSQKGTVSFKLREPGFLRVYEGTWTILPVGADMLNASPPSSPTMRQSRSNSSVLECNLLAAMTNPLLNSPLMGVCEQQDCFGDGMDAEPLLPLPTSPVAEGRAIVRVSNLLMSPKIAPPSFLSHTLKGQVAGQVRATLDGLFAAAKQEQEERAAAKSSAPSDSALTPTPSLSSELAVKPE